MNKKLKEYRLFREYKIIANDATDAREIAAQNCGMICSSGRLFKHLKKDKIVEKSKEKETQVIMVYQKETDGEILIKKLPLEKVRKQVKKYNLDTYDYAIIKGEVLKSFLKKCPIKIVEKSTGKRV